MNIDAYIMSQKEAAEWDHEMAGYVKIPPASSPGGPLGPRVHQVRTFLSTPSIEVAGIKIVVSYFHSKLVK